MCFIKEKSILDVCVFQQLFIRYLLIAFNFYYFFVLIISQNTFVIISSFFSFYTIRKMWKAVGSVRSGDDKSVRSNKSRDQVKFEHFETKSIDRSRQESLINGSFCHDYFKGKRQNFRNMTFDQRCRSQKSLRYDQNNKDDIFTSMRNVNLQNKTSQNKSGLRQVQSTHQIKPAIKTANNNGDVFRNAQNKIKVLKKDQKKLKKLLQEELTGFKNIMLQLQDTIIHTDLSGNAKGQARTQNENESDYDILKQIIAEANGLNSYFGELDRKKDAILANIGK